MRDIVWVLPRGHTSVSKSPFPSAGTAVSLFRAKTVQQRCYWRARLWPQMTDTQLQHFLSQSLHDSSSPSWWNDMSYAYSCSNAKQVRHNALHMIITIIFVVHIQLVQNFPKRKKSNLLLLYNCLSDCSDPHVLFHSVFLCLPEAFFLVGIQLW